MTTRVEELLVELIGEVRALRVVLEPKPKPAKPSSVKPVTIDYEKAQRIADAKLRRLGLLDS